jgi:hypothetical protein
MFDTFHWSGSTRLYHDRPLKKQPTSSPGTAVTQCMRLNQLRFSYKQSCAILELKDAAPASSCTKLIWHVLLEAAQM